MVRKSVCIIVTEGVIHHHSDATKESAFGKSLVHVVLIFIHDSFAPGPCILWHAGSWVSSMYCIIAGNIEMMKIS